MITNYHTKRDVTILYNTKQTERDNGDLLQRSTVQCRWREKESQRLETGPAQRWLAEYCLNEVHCSKSIVLSSNFNSLLLVVGYHLPETVFLFVWRGKWLNFDLLDGVRLICNHHSSFLWRVINMCDEHINKIYATYLEIRSTSECF